MGRQPCCDKVGLKKGPWTVEEDKKLINFILNNGQCCWRAVPKLAGLLRCGKSCRLRWTNYLRPDLKRGLLSEYEEKMVIDLHAQLGNRWSKIASHLRGRTDNEIKNHWNTHIKKKLKKMGIDPVTHKPLSATPPQEQIMQQQQQQPQEKEAEAEAEAADESQQVNEKENITMEFKSVEELNDNNNGFCIDEVPLIQPHEILVPASCSTSSSSPSSSSSSATSCNGSLTTNLFQDMPFLQNFDWDMNIWGDDDFSNLDLFSSSEDLSYPLMMLDEECWKLEALL